MGFSPFHPPTLSPPASTDPLAVKIAYVRHLFADRMPHDILLLRLRILAEYHPIFLSEFLWAFEMQRLTEYMCHFCLRDRFCRKGPQQGLTCAASFAWGPSKPLTEKNTDQRAAELLTLPLTDAALVHLSACDLLGIFYLRRYTLLTLLDVSKFGLRCRLLTIVENNNPYVLTV